MEKKIAVLRWQEEHQIPGKIQSMLTAAPSAEGDWCIRNERHGRQMRLEILGPTNEIEPPEFVEQLFDYLIQEHQYYLRKPMQQVWVRSVGIGQFALLLQTQIRGSGTGHALKLLETFLQRNHPECIALHRVETRPWYSFRLDQPPKAMKYDLHPIFGPEYLPLGNSGHLFHILEWLPQLRHPFMEMPARLLSAINARPGDLLLDLHCGSGLFSCEMAKAFEEVHSMDARGISKLSVVQNLKARNITNVTYYQESVDAESVAAVLNKRKGPWTVILNPQKGEELPSGLIRTIAAGPVGRVIHIGSDLEVLEGEIRRWRRSGMLLRKIIPFDLNPSTNRIELVLFFAPDREGVMRRGVIPIPQPGDEEIPEKKKPIGNAAPRFSQKARGFAKPESENSEEEAPRTSKPTRGARPTRSSEAGRNVRPQRAGETTRNSRPPRTNDSDRNAKPPRTRNDAGRSSRPPRDMGRSDTGRNDFGRNARPQRAGEADRDVRTPKPWETGRNAPAPRSSDARNARSPRVGEIERNVRAPRKPNARPSPVGVRKRGSNGTPRK